MTLTFDLWPWPFELVRDIIKVNPCTKFHDHTSNRSAVRALTNRHTDTHTHTQTDDTVFITSTADAGGKKFIQCIFHINLYYIFFNLTIKVKYTLQYLSFKTWQLWEKSRVGKVTRAKISLMLIKWQNPILGLPRLSHTACTWLYKLHLAMLQVHYTSALAVPLKMEPVIEN